jgi:hypothetical protein
MDLQASENDLAPLTDRDLVVVMIQNGILYENFKRDGTRKTVFYFRQTNDFQDLLFRWKSGVAIPVSDIRDVFSAERIFNSAVHDFY